MECVKCVCTGGVGGVGHEWVRGLGLGFTNPGATWGKWDMCLWFGCVGCESGLFVFMAGPCICILC